MQVRARSFRQPAPGQRGFVCTTVVQDEMDVQFSRDIAVDGVQKLARTMTAMELAEHAIAGYIEGGEQAGGAMALVVVRRSICPERMDSRDAVRSKRLDLTFLVHAQHQGAGGLR